MRRLMIALLCALSLQAFARDASSLSATELERSRELYAEAQALYKGKDYEKALALYQDAYRLSKESGLILSMAQCHRYLGHAEEAIKNYRLYLEKEPSSPYKEQIEPKIQRLEEQLATARAAAQASAATQPATEPVASSMSVVASETYSVYQIKEVAASFDEIEALIQKSEEELAKVKKRLRLVLPGGIALAGGLFGTGAFLLHATIQTTNTVNNRLQAGHLTLAVASDLAFLAAGATLYRALSKNKKESSFEVGFIPTTSGGTLALAFQPRVK